MEVGAEPLSVDKQALFVKLTTLCAPVEAVSLSILSVMVSVTALTPVMKRDVSIYLRPQFVWWVGVVLMKVVLRSTTRDSGELSVMMNGVLWKQEWCVGSLAMRVCGFQRLELPMEREQG
jgi:hypothetical protein